MKQILVLVCIVLSAVFGAGCSTDDAGTTGEAETVSESLPAVSHSGNAMLKNTTEQRSIPSGGMHATAGPMGPMPPGQDLTGEVTGNLPRPPDGMNGTPESMEPGSMPPGQEPPDRSEMH